MTATIHPLARTARPAEAERYACPAARTRLPEPAPICRACGRPDCDHPDPVFAGIVPLHERACA